MNQAECFCKTVLVEPVRITKEQVMMEKSVLTSPAVLEMSYRWTASAGDVHRIRGLKEVESAAGLTHVTTKKSLSAMELVNNVQNIRETMRMRGLALETTVTLTKFNRKMVHALHVLHPLFRMPCRGDAF